MDIKLITPFVDSAKNVLKTMATVEANADEYLIKKDSKTFGDVTGVISLTGAKANGSLIISFQGALILKIVSNMFMEEITELTSEVSDAVGELTNMICGNAKTNLTSLGFAFDMATPFVLTGQNMEVKQLSKTETIVAPFSTEFGRFTVELSLLFND